MIATWGPSRVSSPRRGCSSHLRGVGVLGGFEGFLEGMPSELAAGIEYSGEAQQYPAVELACFSMSQRAAQITPLRLGP